MIRVHDEEDGRIRDVPLTEFFERAESLYGEIPRQTYFSEKKRFQQMAQDVEAACKEAAEMGDPFDAHVQDYQRRHAKLKRPDLSQKPKAANLILPPWIRDN